MHLAHLAEPRCCARAIAAVFTLHLHHQGVVVFDLIVTTETWQNVCYTQERLWHAEQLCTQCVEKLVATHQTARSALHPHPSGMVLWCVPETPFNTKAFWLWLVPVNSPLTFFSTNFCQTQLTSDPPLYPFLSDSSKFNTKTFWHSSTPGHSDTLQHQDTWTLFNTTTFWHSSTPPHFDWQIPLNSHLTLLFIHFCQGCFFPRHSSTPGHSGSDGPL